MASVQDQTCQYPFREGASSQPKMFSQITNTKTPFILTAVNNMHVQAIPSDTAFMTIQRTKTPQLFKPLITISTQILDLQVLTLDSPNNVGNEKIVFISPKQPN